MAVHHLRRMRGGSQAHLMYGSDGRFYVVKFRNNPQHIRVLANEMLATELARHIGLPVPDGVVVEVPEQLIACTPDLHIQLAHHTIRCEPGLHYGSTYVVSPTCGRVYDYLPVEMLECVRNLSAFAGILAFDKWTGNVDGRQAAFWKKHRDRNYTATFIDQGYCFNAGEWTFPDFPLRGVYSRNEVYAGILGWGSFEPWISLISKFAEEKMRAIANVIPREWYGGNKDELDELVTTLIVRKNKVRKLIDEFRESPRRPFENWSDAAKIAYSSRKQDPLESSVLI